LTDAKDNDSFITWNEKTEKIEKRSYTEAKNTTGTLYQTADNCVFIFGDMINGKNPLLRCIGRYGLTLMEQFHRVISSITSTATRSTTILETWKSCLLANIPDTISQTQTPSGPTSKTDGDNQQDSSKLLLIGRKARKAKRPCQSTAKNTPQPQPNALKNGGKPTPPKWSPEKTAKKTLPSLLPPLLSGENGQRQSRFTPTRPGKHSSSIRANLRARCVALLLSPLLGMLKIALRSANIEQQIRKKLQRRRVYNLHVEGTHEYFANGILVHNCMGAAIAWEVLPSATEYTREEAQHEDPPDDQSWKSSAARW
jgi:hypothetical protein